MNEAPTLAKAELRQLSADFASEINRQNWVTVQFNPETLKVTFANQIATQAGASDQNGTPARQFVGAGTTKLAVQLWFDVSAPGSTGAAQPNDVRQLTQKVAFFITPQEVQHNPPQIVPPAVRFLWGSFKFDGLMDSLEESLEYFSAEGRPLRASMALGLSQQKIQPYAFNNLPPPPPGAAGPRGGAPVGTSPLTQAPAGATLQGLVAGAGSGVSWQSIAAANGIDNPRLLQPGQLIDLSVQAPTVSVTL
jgi:hypothetical protein